MTFWKTFAAVHFLVTILAMPARAQQQDVTFFVIGKHANYEQTTDGRRQPVDFSFFSEIFLTSDGDASSAFLNMPTGERIRFRDQRLVDEPEHDNLLLISGAKRFSSYAELLSWYPDGTYRIDFDTPSGSVSSATLNFPVNGLPEAPAISLSQQDEPRCEVVDPNRDLVVRWSPFARGAADENGILDDLIFAILEDESGTRVAHSGRPFEGKPFLTYADSHYVVPASALRDGGQYTLSVEHAILTDTQKIDSVPAMTTYAVTTKLRFQAQQSGPWGCADKAAAKRPGTLEQVVMFYYPDLNAVDHFYGDVLQLEKTLDYDWVKFYRTSPNGTVGLVADSDGAWHRSQRKNAVMLSIVTDEVDAWYQHLKKDSNVVFLKEIGDGGPIRSFLVEDPGGYTVEFFQWLPAAAD